MALSVPDYRFKIPWQLWNTLSAEADLVVPSAKFFRELRTLVGYALLVPALLLAGAGVMLFLVSAPKTSYWCLQ